MHANSSLKRRKGHITVQSYSRGLKRECLLYVGVIRPFYVIGVTCFDVISVFDHLVSVLIML